MTAPLLRAKEVAELLSCSRSTVCKLTKSGELHCVTVLSVPRYTHEQVADYIERHSSKPRVASFRTRK